MQCRLDIFIDGFARVGLKMNATKTEAMTMQGGRAVHRISDKAYSRCLTGIGTSYKEHSLQKVQCNHCGRLVNCQYLSKHQTTIKCQNSKATEEELNLIESEAHVSMSEEEEEHEPAEYQISMPGKVNICLLYTSPSPRDGLLSRMPSSA